METFLKQDSYQQYKKYLEQTIGISAIKAPHLPLKPYMRFYLERSSQQRSKGQVQWAQFSRLISQQWKNLEAKKKKFYQQSYQIQLRQRNQLIKKYHILVGKTKSKTPYLKYYEKKYAQLMKQMDVPSTDITPLISIKWRNMTDKEKSKYIEESNKEKINIQRLKNSQNFLEDYLQQTAQYNQKIQEEKERLQKKYGSKKITREQKRKTKMQQKQKQRAIKQIEKEKKAKEKEEAKKKLKEEKKKLLASTKQETKKQKKGQRQILRESQKPKIESSRQKQKQMKQKQKTQIEKTATKSYRKKSIQPKREVSKQRMIIEKKSKRKIIKKEDSQQIKIRQKKDNKSKKLKAKKSRKGNRKR